VTKRVPLQRVVPLPLRDRADVPRRDYRWYEPNPLRVLVIECDPVLGGRLVAELATLDDRLIVVGWVPGLDGAAELADATDADVVLTGKVVGVELDGIATGLREAGSSAPIVALVDSPGADVGAADGEPIAGFIARTSRPSDIARSFFEIARIALASSGGGTG
jgi:hypothetical protein